MENRSDTRKLVIDGNTWQYKIGQSFIHIWSPSGKKNILSVSTVAGRHPDVIDKGRRKGTPDGMITPGQIKAYIQNYL